MNEELKQQFQEELGFQEKNGLPFKALYLEKDNWWFVLRDTPTWETNGNGQLTGEKKPYLLIISRDPNKTEIDIDNHLPRYYGPCKSIEDFRMICKLLEI